ncbi:MAG: hypothetical protein Q4C70_01295 [Planctomycetia bacterium]|nr:hypothetical protein [Planctomycetia bacterium]
MEKASRWKLSPSISDASAQLAKRYDNDETYYSPQYFSPHIYDSLFIEDGKIIAYPENFSWEIYKRAAALRVTAYQSSIGTSVAYRTETVRLDPGESYTFGEITETQLAQFHAEINA